MFLLFVSPILFFRDRLASQPSWLLAVVPLLLLVAGNTVSASIMLFRSQAAISGGGIAEAAAIGAIFVTVVFSESLVFWLSTGAIAALDVMFAGSGKGRKIIEFSAFSFWPQAVWGVVGCFVAWLFFHPDAPEISEQMTTIQVRQTMIDYQSYVESTVFMRTYRLVGAYAAAGVVALQCCILRAVSRFSVTGTWISGLTLGLLFVAIPWAIQRF